MMVTTNQKAEVPARKRVRVKAGVGVAVKRGQKGRKGEA